MQTAVNDAYITRAEEAALYAYMNRMDIDAFRYLLIAQKVQRAANGTVNEWDKEIVGDWLNAMKEDATKMVDVSSEPDAQDFNLGAGIAGNPLYQAFLDTLEQDELEALQNNAPFIIWVSQRTAESRQQGLTGAEANDYPRKWADQNLSQRVTMQRELGIALGQV